MTVNRNKASITLPVKVDRTVEFFDGDVLDGLTPRGKATFRVRVAGRWTYFNGKPTGKSDKGYAKGVLAGRYTKAFTIV